MNKLILAVLALAGFVQAQISALSLPHTLDSATIPKVSYVDDNDVALRNRLNIVIDSVNGDSILTLLRSNSSLRLTLDADNNGTGTCFAVTHNGASDTIAKFCDDLSARNFGALTVSGTLAAANGTYSGTLGVFGLMTADDGIQIGTNGTSAEGRIVVSGANGLELRAQNVAGTYDFAIRSAAAGSGLFLNPTGTLDVLVGNSAGTTTTRGPAVNSSTLTQTGIQSNAEAIAFTANGTGGDGRIWRSAGGGTSIRGIAGSSYDLAIYTVGGNFLLNNPTGTQSLNFPGSGTNTFTGAVTMASTLGVTGAITNTVLAGTGTRLTTSTSTGVLGNATTIAGANTWSGVQTLTLAPVFSSVTASLPLFTNGSNALVSNAMTGTGSVVMSTSPTLVTPALGAATATSLVASGNVTADSLISSKFYEESTYTGTMTGITGSVTRTVRYVRVGKQVTIILPAFTGTSNTAECTLTGMPASIRPARAIEMPGVVADNGTSTTTTTSGIQIQTSGTIALVFNGSTIGFTASGTKGFMGSTGAANAQSFSYTLQ